MRLILLPALMFSFLFSSSLLWAEQSPAVENTAVNGQHQTGLPARGSTMNQVKKKFGNPQQIIGPSGEASKSRPPITRWVYKDYVVYFENNRVIHSAKPRSLNIIKFLDTPVSPQQPATDSP